MSYAGKFAVSMAVAAGCVALWLTPAVGQPGEQPNPPAVKLNPSEMPPGCLQVVSQPGEPITAVVYDPQQQVLGVYHVDRESGEIELMSVRRIEWDLQLMRHNAKKPFPEAIRQELQSIPN